MNLEDVKLRILTLGGDTAGVVTAEDLRLGGVSLDDLARAVAAEWLDRPVRGVYLPRHSPASEEVKLHIARAHAGAGCVVTGLFAARLLKLKWVPESVEVQMLVPHHRRRRGTESFVRIRRCSWLEEMKTSYVYGVKVAPIAQVVVDGARECRSLQDVRGLVLGALADNRCTVAAIRAILERSAPAGTAWVRRACLDAERGAASPPEAELVDAMIGRGRPFYVNCEVWLNGVLLGIADVWLVGCGTGGEMDSREWHAEPELLDATLLRDKNFTRSTLSLEHITPTRFRKNPTGFVNDLFAEADRRAAAGIGEPAGLVLKPSGPLLH